MTFDIVIHLGPKEQMMCEQFIEALQHFASGVERLAEVAEDLRGGTPTDQSTVDALVAQLRQSNVKLADEVAAHFITPPAAHSNS